MRGRLVVLRPVGADDIAPLNEVLATPEVARWWPAYDGPRVEREFLASDDDESIYVIEREGQPIGAIIANEEQEPEFRHASIDLFLDPAFHGQGLGTDAIRTVAASLIDDEGHHRLTIDPAADNDIAIRVYERVGFRPVGRLRRYQRMADGAWADGLLMEMLADELVR
ncbi:MAG: GNAT family N-acetyltransferase [Chloroflexi bacterium]|nr:GNAT family N-acetyltransferase [Chloroflexota bacterium]